MHFSPKVANERKKINVNFKFELRVTQRGENVRAPFAVLDVRLRHATEPKATIESIMQITFN